MMDGRGLSRQGRIIPALCAVLVFMAFIAFGPKVDLGTPNRDAIGDFVANERARMEKQERFYKEELEPVLLVRLRTYPVESVRAQLIEVIDQLMSDEIVLAHRADYSWNVPSAFAQAARLRDGRRVIIFELLGLQERFSLWRREGIIDDTLAEILLHEYFHIVHHVDHIPVPDTLERFQADESEAWFYTCRDVMQPMLDAGRFPRGDMDGVAATAYDAYVHSGRNPTDPIWINMIKRLHPHLPSSGEE